MLFLKLILKLFQIAFNTEKWLGNVFFFVSAEPWDSAFRQYRYATVASDTIICSQIGT